MQQQRCHNQDSNEKAERKRKQEGREDSCVNFQGGWLSVEVMTSGGGSHQDCQGTTHGLQIQQVPQGDTRVMVGPGTNAT